MDPPKDEEADEENAEFKADVAVLKKQLLQLLDWILISMKVLVWRLPK